MNDWLDAFASELEVGAPSARLRSTLLELAREVAHSTERKNAPLSTYLAGAFAARRMAEGASLEEAVAEALEAARRLLPETDEGPSS